MYERKYNFVIFGSNDDFYRAAYFDLMNLDYVRYIGASMQCRCKLINAIFRLHTSPKVNKHIRLPFKNIYNRFYFRNDFARDYPICFLFFGYLRGKILDWGYYRYIKKYYPNAKLVCFFQDLVSSNTNLILDKFRKYFDLILSFDHEDAEKYELIYYPLVYSKGCPFRLSDNYSKSDVFFAGKAKNRLNEIISTYEKLSEAGLNCDFHVIDAIGEKPYSKQIDYCSLMPYDAYLGRLKATHCVLELMQHGGHGYTLRTNEAIVYRKKLLSNNPELLKAPFYHPSYILVFNNPDEIDTRFIKAQIDSINYAYAEQLSPLALLSFIENKLTTEGEL